MALARMLLGAVAITSILGVSSCDPTGAIAPEATPSAPIATGDTSPPIARPSTSPVRPPATPPINQSGP